MNRATKRQQQKLARKAANNGRGQPPQRPGPAGEAVTIHHPGPDTALQSAISHHQTGRLDAVKRLYADVLSRDPEQVMALHFLGIIAYHQGAPRQAVASIGRVIVFKPDYA